MGDGHGQAVNDNVFFGDAVFCGFIEYLFGKVAILPYKVIFVILVVVGAVLLPKVVWDFADLANGLMAIPNLISLLLLSKVIVAETDKYLWHGDVEAESQDPVIEIHTMRRDRKSGV